MIEMHAIVLGDVQGVGFRATTRRLALQMGLNGTVRNMPEGSVEIFIIGNPKAIETFFLRLRGFYKDHISEIKKQEITPARTYDKFDIIR